MAERSNTAELKSFPLPKILAPFFLFGSVLNISLLFSELRQHPIDLVVQRMVAIIGFALLFIFAFRIRPLSRDGRHIVIGSFIWFLATLTYFPHRTVLIQFLMLPVFLYFLFIFLKSTITIFTEWRQRQWRALIPFATCLLLTSLTGDISILIRDAIFEQHLPSYQAIVDDIKSGSVTITNNWNRIPLTESQTRLAYGVEALKNTNGTLSVEFLTEGGFPVKHSGYLYTSSETVDPEEASRWPFLRKMKPNWFYVSD